MPIGLSEGVVAGDRRQRSLYDMTAIHTTVAGIAIPDSQLAREATEFVQDVSTQLLYDHSRRVFLWASLQGEKLGLDYDPELLYVGAMFHDIGLVEGHRSEHERFEIDGANAARAFLERHGLPEERVMTVWESIALHTTPEVPRYKQPEVRLVTLGVEYDVLGLHFDELSPEQRKRSWAPIRALASRKESWRPSRRVCATSPRPRSG